METQFFAGFLRQFVRRLRLCQIAEQFFHIVLHAVADFTQRSCTHPHHAPLIAVRTRHPRFFVAADADTRHIVFNYRRHQQIDAVTVSIGFQNRTNLRLAAQVFLQSFDIASVGRCIDFQPGVGVIAGDFGGLLVFHV